MKTDDPGYFPGSVFFFPDMHETRKMGILIGIIYVVKPVIAHLYSALIPSRANKNVFLYRSKPHDVVSKTNSPMDYTF
jgi:hypothetical protein